MSSHFYPQSLLSLLKEIFGQIENQQDILALPSSCIFNPSKYPELKTIRYGQHLSTPYGVAAGPHTQLARNIISAWLMGARYIELKTIQTLDELAVKKPCIDMQDEGYNCEWSQELKIEQSFNEYLNAWIVIHVLAHKFKFVQGPEIIFNMSVGYDLKGILNDNVQWFLEQMKEAGVLLEEKRQEIQALYPDIYEIEIPSCISNNITLSTMHGCPPEEVEQISRYLIEDRKLHTTVKLNPTLLGSESLRNILNVQLNYPIEVPDIAFDHDLKYADAVPMIHSLWKLSKNNDLDFSIKLTNTLEVTNKLKILPEDMLYMSGRALHPIAVELAAKLQNEFNGKLDISFSAGADAFNMGSLLHSGLFPVTVCSDLLKPGGYSRLYQYADLIKAENIDSGFLNKKNHQYDNIKSKFLQTYASEAILDERYKYSLLESKNIKSDRPLNSFDCIAAPCMDACPTEQDIPDYLYLASKGKFNEALDVIYLKNPLPRTLGLVCEHSCQTKCTRVNYDSAVRIRDVKEFIARYGKPSVLKPKAKNDIKVAIIGAGPSGLSAAWFLAIEGCEVEIFEKSDRVGGVPSSIIPEFRLNKNALDSDIDRILNMGVIINYNQEISAFDIENLEESFDYIYLAIGANKNRKLSIPGIDHKVIKDPLDFLKKHKLQQAEDEYAKVIVIGGGNTAMDVARMAKKAQVSGGSVQLLYRRTLSQMPAEKQEILDAIEEGIEIKELLSPIELIMKADKFMLKLQKMSLSEEIGSDGRNKVEAIPNEYIEIESDCIIPALGQISEPIIDRFNDLSLNVDFNKDTKVYAGGDLARGGSSIVQAVADGREFAELVLNDRELNVLGLNQKNILKMDSGLHLKERGIRINSDFPTGSADILERQTIDEAARCLQCDEYCNICVSVCPNRANYFYELNAQEYSYQNIEVNGHHFELSNLKTKSISQSSQVYNVVDYCNECGNCSTFCPTIGDPYKDKPQVHLSKESFENSKIGSFISNSILYYKNDLYSAQVKEDSGKFLFEDDRVEVVLSKATLKVLDVFIKKEGDYTVDLSLMIEMKLIIENIP